MGHRHVFSPSYIFETENDQRWNLTEHPYAHTAHNDAIESSPRSYTANNMSINGEQYPSNSNPADASNQYYSLAHAIETRHYQHDPVGSSNPLPVPENYGNVASSSNHNELPVPEEESFDVRGSNGRWNCKRKRPDVPTEDTDRFTNNVGGSSSNISTPSDSWDDTPNLDFLDTPWDHPNVKYAHGDGSYYRNVRSRIEHNTSSHDYHTTRYPMDVSSHGSMTEWNPNHTSSSGHGQELNPFLVGSSTSSNNVPQDFHGNQVQSVRGPRRHYVQRSAPPFRSSSSSLQLEHADEGLQLANESYSSPPPRPAIAWRSSDRNARGRMSIERFRSEMANFRDRHAPEPRRAYLDMNKHVNNVTYIGRALESFLQEVRDTHEMQTISLDFKCECQHDDIVDSLKSPEPLSIASNESIAFKQDGKNLSRFLHLLRSSSDGLEKTRCRTEWRKLPVTR